MSPFQAVGDRPKWQYIYDVIVAAKVGDVIEYAQLDAALGEDFRSNRHPLAKAERELLEVNKRAIEVVRGRGYRVVEPNEHVLLAKRRQKRARRQIASGIRTTRGTNRSALTPDELMRLDRLEATLADQLDILRRHETRIAKLEEVTKRKAKERSSDDERRDQRVERLYAALEKAGIDVENL